MNDTLKIVGALALIVLAIFLFRKNASDSENSQDFAGDSWLLCQECQHGFATSREALADWYASNPDTAMACDDCGKNTTIRALKCPLDACGKVYPDSMGFVTVDGKVSCPVCRQPLP